MFTIYSIGDAAFLEQILNAVAMITGTGNFTKIVSIGLLLGVIMVFIQSVFQGAKQINIHQVLLGWMLYACFFLPTTTVTIEDSVSGDVRVVSNVPIGLGFVGGTISRLGYGITTLFEDGYGIIAPKITERYFAESLKLLNNVRNMGSDPRLFLALNATIGGSDVDIRESWKNYIRECTLTKVDLGEMTVDKLMDAPTNDALRFASNLYGTRLYLGTPGGEDYTCSEAWTLLTSETAKINSPIVIEAMNKILDPDGKIIGIGGVNDSWTKINDALDSLGIVSDTANEYVKASILEPIYYEAAIGRYEDLNDYTSALMINQAIKQRNTQWSAEQSMFMSVVRPLLTFFEGFIYAITPVMAFIIVMGSFGMQLAAKYLQTILWIQLWLPVLSIINLFIYTAASQQMSSYDGIQSMYALAETKDVLEHWIATGGMLAAATPIISLFLVTGSTFAFTSLAGRINGADHIDEKMQTPDLLKQGPLMQSQAANTHNSFSGTQRSGTENLLGNFSIGESLSSSEMSARSRQNQASQAFNQTLGRAISEGSNINSTYSKLQSLGKGISSMNTKQSQLVDAEAKNFMEHFGISNEHSDAVKGGIAYALANNLDLVEAIKDMIPAGKAMKGAKAIKALFGGKKDEKTNERDKGPATADAQQTFKAASEANDSTKESGGSTDNYTRAINWTENDSANLTDQVAELTSKASGDTWTKTWGDTTSENLSKAAQEQQSATKAYTVAHQAMAQMGHMTNVDFKQLAGAVVNSPEAMNQMSQYMRFASSGEKQQAQSLAQRFQQQYHMTPSIASAAANMIAMADSDSTDGKRALLGVYSAATGRGTPELGNSSENENINKINPDGSGVEEGVNSTVEPPSQRAWDVKNEVNREQTEGQNDLNGAQNTVNEHHEKAQSDLENEAQNRAHEVSAPYVRKSRDRITNNDIDPSTAAALFGSTDNLGDWFKRKTEQWGGAAMQGIGVAEGEFDKLQEAIKTLTPEQKEKFIQDIKNGDKAISDEYGMAGDVYNALNDAGRWMAGVSASAAYAVDSWLNGGEDNISEAIEDMSYRERGAFLSSAFDAAASKGVEAASQFMKAHGAEFKAVMKNTAINSYGLDDKQAAIYAESFSTDDDVMNGLVRNLKMDYAERDENGKVKLDDNNQPILSKDNEDFTNKLVETIQASSVAGDRAGSYLNNVRGYNIARKQFENTK